jgi:signal transduction histidine kinase
VRSLRVRLLLLMVLVLAAMGGLAAWLAGRAIAARFQQYLVTRQAASEERRTQLEALLPLLLADHYAVTGTLAETPDLLLRMAELTEERILLTDPNGVLLFDSDEETDAAIDITQDAPVPIRVGDEIIGLLYIPAPPPVYNNASERAYIDQVNRSLLIAVSLAGGLGILLMLALSHGILTRIRTLTTAVQAMERGDLHQRVPNHQKDEIDRLAHAFNSMADSLAHIEQLRRNMVSDVAHELRTPLSDIRGYLEAIQDGLVQPSAEVIGSLHEEALLLNRLINDLQELAVADAGELKLARQRIAVGELVDKAVQAVRGRVNGSRVIHTHIAPNLPEVLADSERIGQVLRNLLNNAVEYSPTGGAITVGVRQVDGQLQVNVYNEGDGIAPEHLPNVFERFYRVDDSRTRATGGSGLGLAIVKQLVEAHGGRVWAESKPGHYANFVFTLPIAAPTATHS